MNLLDERRKNGLCARCAAALTEKERAMEGVGGSYVRCDKCVAEIRQGVADNLPQQETSDA